ncbi:MAG: hypothetical protein ACREAA_14495 [Candidatus Polarisedimenticolia bacterium]
MRPRFVAVIVCVVMILPVSLHAAQPEGVVGKLLTNPDLQDGCQRGGFERYMFFGDHQLDSSDILKLELALIPFRSGSTEMAISDSRGQQYLNLRFVNGRVTDGYRVDLGLAYQRARWNDVTVTMRPGTQDYLVTVNGSQAGPFPYDPYCELGGGCFTANAFSYYGLESGGETVGWIDSLSLNRESSTGTELLLVDGFEECAQRMSWGGTLLVPLRLSPGAH